MPSSSTSVVAPPFLVLAGHPLRWRMLVELAWSDRRVSDLTRATGQSQGLVSYHLGRLRAGGLVSSQRSSFDGRAAFYRVHLGRCGELLSATGAALHPGLASSGSAAGTDLVAGERRRMRVLFVCTGNGTRSQIAEGLLRDMAPDLAEVRSAGSHPKPVHPNAVAVLSERGVDISGARSKPITDVRGERFDYVITLCDKVREVCPEFPGQRESMHWSVEDPGRHGGSARSTLPAFRAVAADLESRIGFLVLRLAAELNKEPSRHDR